MHNDVEPDAPVVLVVDDDPHIARMAEMILQKSSYRTKVAHSPHQALEHLQEVRPDVVLLDVMLPEMDGFELLQKMQSYGIAPGDVIMISALGSKDNVEHAQSFGIHSYLKKPFTRADMLFAVSDCIAIQKERASAQASANG